MWGKYTTVTIHYHPSFNFLPVILGGMGHFLHALLLFTYFPLKLLKLSCCYLVLLDPAGQQWLPRVEESVLKFWRGKFNQQSNHFCCDGKKKKKKKEASVNDKTSVDHQKSQLELEGGRPKKNCLEGMALKGKWIRKEFWSVRMHCLITLNSPLSLPEFFLFFFKNNLLTSLRPQLSSVTQITRCCIP